jgi:AcrR family transcriptional regulator
LFINGGVQIEILCLAGEFAEDLVAQVCALPHPKRISETVTRPLNRVSCWPTARWPMTRLTPHGNGGSWPRWPRSSAGRRPWSRASIAAPMAGWPRSWSPQVASGQLAAVGFHHALGPGDPVRVPGVPTNGPRATSGGLRERKRLRTRRALQVEALRLFEQKGYEATTIEEIAAAAEVSPRTFSRYFPAKEDVVLWDDFEPTFFQLLAERPRDESLTESVRQALREGLRSIGADDLKRMQRRMRLLYSTPALRARGYPQLAGMMRRLVPYGAQRLGLPPDDPRLRVFAGAVMGGFVALFELWQERGGEVDDELLEVLLAAVDFDLLNATSKPFVADGSE